MNNYRKHLKKIYKQKRKFDGKSVGLRLNTLFQVLHNQTKLAKEKRDDILIKDTLEEISEIRKEKRFREEFVSFASFKEFVIKNNISLEELDKA